MGNLLGNLLENLLENIWQTPVTSLYRYEEPWRQPSVWDDKLEKSLIIEIMKQQSDSLQNVLILGPTEEGISSFINSTTQIFQRFNHLTSMDDADNAPILQRLTSAEHLHGDTVFYLSGETCIGEEINIVDSKLFIKSYSEKEYLFNPVATSRYYLHRFGHGRPSFGHRLRTDCQIHCVTFIVCARDIIAGAREYKEMKQLHQQLRQKRIPVVFVLTMVDKICEEVSFDITKMFRSMKVKEVIETASEIFGIEQFSIHPVVSNDYFGDPTEYNIPLLLALKQLMTYVTVYIQMNVDDGHDHGSDTIQLHYSEGRRYLSKQMPIRKKQTTDSLSWKYTPTIDRVEKLLRENDLPRNADLQSIYKDHGRKYEPLKVICEKICNIIKRQLYTYAVKNIWPARNLANENIVFVVDLMKKPAIYPIFAHDLEILIYHGDSTGKKESIKIMTKERDFLKNKTDEYRNRLKSLQPILRRHSKKLMDKHKNITAILPCVIRSVGYGTSETHFLIETSCISIHVKRKIRGLIPLDEEPIPRMVENIPTDVVQGECRLLSKGPNDYHSNLKMGLAICTQSSSGTLGCFVQHDKYGMCCLTNAHVVLQESELQHLFRCGYMEYETNNGKSVFQPIYSETEPFGKVVAAAGYEGNAYKSGSEVALIQILNRLPLSGSFPHSTSESAPTFEFNTGSVTAVNWQDLGKEVFKFGMVTGPTNGLLKSYDASIRYNESIQLHQQIEVIPATDKSFAASGDSGASVFVEFHRPGRESVIGLISAGEDEGQGIFITPIHEILQSVKCQPSLHRFENIDDN